MATPTLSTDKAGDPVGHGGHAMGTGNMEEPVTNLEELKARWASKEGGSAQFHQPLLNPLQNPIGWCARSQGRGSPARGSVPRVVSLLACSVHDPLLESSGFCVPASPKSSRPRQFFRSKANDSLLAHLALPSTLSVSPRLLTV